MLHEGQGFLLTVCGQTIQRGRAENLYVSPPHPPAAEKPHARKLSNLSVRITAHSGGEAPCLLLLEKVARRPDVEGTR